MNSQRESGSGCDHLHTSLCALRPVAVLGLGPWEAASPTERDSPSEHGAPVHEGRPGQQGDSAERVGSEL